ncbi:MAG: sulfatase-like hydrolase/transferase [Saprospiraceae bacterium]
MKQIFLSTLIVMIGSTILSAQSPNIIVILSDDQGWTGSSRQMKSTLNNSKSDFYITPNMERIATNGVTFSQGYAPAAKCAPTRNSILTGQTPAKTLFTTTGNGVSSGEILNAPTISSSIEASQVTLPEIIKQVAPNYWSAHFGKWHLGSVTPDNHGFDRHDGSNGNEVGNAANGLSIQNDPKKIFTITDSAMNFMDDAVNNNRPFYMQLSHYAVHSANEATQSSFNLCSNAALRPPGATHNDPLYGAMTEDLDKGIGLVLDKLDSLGIANNTYVIYLSDNGASTGQSNNTPLKRGKTFLYEGGIRVPFFISGPNIPANTYSNIPIVGYDLYPTIVEWITGNTVAVPTAVEGTSFTSVLNNSATTLNRAKPIIFHSPHYDTNGAKKPSSAIVVDNYKLYVNYESGSFELYDLDVNIRENNNLFSSEPTIATDLCLQLRDYLKSVNADMPTLNEAHANNPGTGNDVDNDGLDDDWEFRELLTYHYDGTDDPDGDGQNNAMEFANGTDPYQNLVNTEHLITQNQVRVFPNPFNQQLNVELSSELINSTIYMSVVDVYGQQIRAYTFDNESSIVLNTSDFPKGVLFLNIRDSNQKLIVTKRVVSMK